MHSAHLRIQSSFAGEIRAAIGPELGEEIPRSSITLSHGDTDSQDVLVFEIRAEDTVALRAALNSYLRWISLAENVARKC